MPNKILTSGFLALAASTAHGAQFNVNSGNDFIDGDPGDGVCAVQFFGDVCTLRAAVMEANALPGTDTILIAPNFTMDLEADVDADDSARFGDLDIYESVAIIGNGTPKTLVRMNGTSRIFHVHDTAENVVFFGLELTGGIANRSSEGTGGAISVEIGDSEVEILSSRFHGNFANSGGAIYNDATMDISFSEIYENGLVDDVLAPTFIRGSGIRNRGQMIIEKTTVHSNDSRRTPEDIGGFAIHSTPINDNFDAPLLRIVNSTVSGNIGSGIISREGVLSVKNSTITEQTRLGLRFVPSAGVDNQYFTRNSVIANNGTEDCLIGGNEDDWSANGYNADSDDTCEFGSGSSNFPGINAMLDILQDNGGATPTHLPLPNSPLIDNGHPAAPGIAIACEIQDQRNRPRPQDGDDDGSQRCDIGAVEVQEPPEIDDLIFEDGFEDI